MRRRMPGASSSNLEPDGADRRARRPAFTLMECLGASAILAVAVLAIAQVLTAGQAQAQYALHEERAMALAEALMEEVLSLPYRDPQGATAPGRDAGETGRTTFDNADDYHSYTDGPGQLTDRSGATYPTEYQGFRRNVTAAYGTVDAGLGAAIPGLTVTATVTDTNGRTWMLTRFVAEPRP